MNKINIESFIIEAIQSVAPEIEKSNINRVAVHVFLFWIRETNCTF